MTDLLSSVLDAHGGLARWRAFDMVEAIFMFDGRLVQTKVSPYRYDRVRLARSLFAGSGGYREPGRRAAVGASNATRGVRRSRSDHSVGSAASGLFCGLHAVELSQRPLSSPSRA